MSLQTQINNELNRIGTFARDANPPRQVRMAVDGGQIECALRALDRLACELEMVALQTTRLDNASLEQLRHTADTLSTQISYLLEAIGPVEVDRESCVVQLRSLPPAKDDRGSSYYELLVRRGEIRLCRYRKSPGQPRHVIPAQLTREVLARLATDFVQATAGLKNETAAVSKS